MDISVTRDFVELVVMNLFGKDEDSIDFHWEEKMPHVLRVKLKHGEYVFALDLYEDELCSIVSDYLNLRSKVVTNDITLEIYNIDDEEEYMAIFSSD